MSTRAHIGMIELDNDTPKVTYIYLHFDGFPDSVLPKLTQHYTTKEKMTELLSLGDLSVLDENIGEQVSFDDYAARENNKQCLAYHRDRGKDLSVTEIHHDLAKQTFVRQSKSVDHWYLFDCETQSWSYS